MLAPNIETPDTEADALLDAAKECSRLHDRAEDAALALINAVGDDEEANARLIHTGALAFIHRIKGRDRAAVLQNNLRPASRIPNNTSRTPEAISAGQRELRHAILATYTVGNKKLGECTGKELLAEGQKALESAKGWTIRGNLMIEIGRKAGDERADAVLSEKQATEILVRVEREVREGQGGRDFQDQAAARTPARNGREKRKKSVA